MIRFKSITVVLIIIGKITLNAQISVSSGLTEDSHEKNDNDLIKSSAKIGGSVFDRNELRIRAGDTYDHYYGSNQVLLSFYQTRLYTHAIKSRHNSEASFDNAIDFYVWDPVNDDSSSVGSKLVMSLNNGSVGIGTVEPKSKLHIYNNTPDVGLKLQNNADAFDLRVVDLGNGSRTKFIHEDELKMEFYRDCEGPRVSSITMVENLDIPYNFNALDLSYTQGISYLKNGSYKFRIRETGDATFDGKLTVKEIEVKPKVWADHVFSDDFNLQGLSQLEDFITANNHLPGVPTAGEVQERGLNLGEMNAILIQKIEELTLYIIEQEKRISELEEKLK